MRLRVPNGAVARKRQATLLAPTALRMPTPTRDSSRRRQTGDVAAIRAALADGADPDARDAAGHTRAHGRHGRPPADAVRALIDAEADVDAQDAEARQPVPVRRRRGPARHPAGWRTRPAPTRRSPTATAGWRSSRRRSAGTSRSSATSWTRPTSTSTTSTSWAGPRCSRRSCCPTAGRRHQEIVAPADRARRGRGPGRRRRRPATGACASQGPEPRSWRCSRRPAPRP